MSHVLDLGELGSRMVSLQAADGSAVAQSFPAGDGLFLSPGSLGCAVLAVVHSGTAAHPIPPRAGGCHPFKIHRLESHPAPSVAKERIISVAHEGTTGAESHLAAAAALWQQRFRDASRG